MKIVLVFTKKQRKDKPKMHEQSSINFSVNGSFITNLARERFYKNHNLKSALELLTNALCSDQIDDEQRMILALKILNYDAEIVGTYPGEDYGVDIINDISSFDKIVTMTDQPHAEIERLQNEYQELLKRYLFICDSLSEYKIDDLNAAYYNENDEPLFSDIEIPAWKKSHVVYNDTSPMLESYLNMKRRENSDESLTYEEYGWLSPQGDFYPGEWSTHEKWASDYLNENYPFNENADLYWLENSSSGEKQHITGGDVMIYKLGWCLIDSPYRGEGNPRYNVIRGLTKEQKEFLYDYFIERNRNKEASALYND